MCLRVDFILIEVPLAHRRVKVVVFVHHCIFPSFLFLKSVILVTCTVSGGNIEPGGPNEVMYKSILRVYTLVPMRCCLCILLYISSKVVPMRWCVRVYKSLYIRPNEVLSTTVYYCILRARWS